MKSKSLVLLVGLLGLSPRLTAQDDRISTDRPDQTESPSVVGKNVFQTEFGFNYENTGDTRSIVHPTSLFRYGISNRIEIRLNTDVVSEKNKLFSANKFITGLQPVQIGAKWEWWEEKGILPKTSLLAHIAPSFLASSTFKTTYWAPSFRLSMENTISEKISVGYNLGADWDGENKTPAWAYTTSWNFELNEKLNNFFEIYGSIQNHEKPDPNLSTGFDYFLNNDIMLDISAGKSLSQKQEWFAALGFSLRLH